MDTSSYHHSRTTTIDVFLSSSRDDDSFTKRLYESLSGLGIMVCMDEKKHLIEDNLNDDIVKAIEESKCSIVVLSKGYASSKWCLKELAKIMDHMDEKTHPVLPVFYHRLPIHVQYQQHIPEFIDGNQKEKYSDEVRRWRKAMRKISALPGIHGGKVYPVFKIRIITQKIFHMLHHLKLVAPNRCFLEMPVRLHRMEMFLGLESNDVRFIGIVGMGGIGKTTIAEFLYDKFAPTFERSCFLRVADCNLVSLQQRLLSQLRLKNDIKILDENHGVRKLGSYLIHTKVLIVLDGISEKRQLEMLAGSPDWFDAKSRIIITTRNKDILRQPNYKDKVQEYNVELLSDTSAVLLFCKHAFGDNPPDEYLKDLCNDIIQKLGRLPLALTKIASSLYGQGIDMWEETLKSCPKLVYENIFFDILKTSYEGLEADSQQMFLDLACFFNGEKVDRVIEILKSFGYSSPHTKLQLLADRCLIDISDEQIQMHILILCMAQEIVHHELPTHQGKQKQSRIWLREDVGRVFREKYEIKYIQGIVMDLEEEVEVVVEAKSFTKMTELKILQINNVQLEGDIEFLSNRLTLLNWPGCPSKCLPSTFQPPTLLELHLPGSNVEQLWNGRKKFLNLMEIDASESKYLIETPDFSEVPNLQRLILRNCKSLHKVHPSINSLKRLVLLNLEGCVNLKRFSSTINCKRLRTLVLSDSGLEVSPKFEYWMGGLTQLHMDGTIIPELSPSISNLIGLVVLNLKNCTKLSSLPAQMSDLLSLTTLILNGCKNINKIHPNLNLYSLSEFDIGGTSISLTSGVESLLPKLRILNCERLSRDIWHSLVDLSIPFLGLRDLNLSDCNLVDEDIPNDLHNFVKLEILDLSSNHFVWLSESLQQLINLKALYLNDCNKLKKLPRLPASLRYVGGEKSSDMFRNSQGSSTNINYDYSKEIGTSSYSNEVDILNNMRKQCPKLVASSQTLVGMENQVEKVCCLLHLERLNDILLVGIFGLGGIGKTSIAEVVYNKIADKFEGSCFLYISKQNNLASLQQQMLSQLLSKEIQSRDDDQRVDMIKDLMSNKKVLIVLDGIDEKKQIEKLAGSPDWFAPGSRVIITSRNEDILHQLNYNYNMQEYNMELLSRESAYELFCKHAFGDSIWDKNDLCNEIVEKVGRLPLALKTIGSFLHNKDFDVWEQTLKRLGKVEEDFFDTILRRSRENLHQKAI